MQVLLGVYAEGWPCHWLAGEVGGGAGRGGGGVDIDPGSHTNSPFNHRTQLVRRAQDSGALWWWWWLSGDPLTPLFDDSHSNWSVNSCDKFGRRRLFSPSAEKLRGGGVIISTPRLCLVNPRLTGGGAFDAPPPEYSR